MLYQNLKEYMKKRPPQSNSAVALKSPSHFLPQTPVYIYRILVCQSYVWYKITLSR